MRTTASESTMDWSMDEGSLGPDTLPNEFMGRFGCIHNMERVDVPNQGYSWIAPLNVPLTFIGALSVGEF